MYLVNLDHRTRVFYTACDLHHLKYQDRYGRGRLSDYTFYSRLANCLFILTSLTPGVAENSNLTRLDY